MANRLQVSVNMAGSSGFVYNLAEIGPLTASPELFRGF